MRLVTPLTFPDANARTSAEVSLAKREREAVQVLISSAADVDWSGVSLVMPKLMRLDGTAFAGTVTWQRQGYLAREFGANQHPFSFPANEKWFPDPLMPAAPMRVRPASTQGTWVTVYADAAAEAGIYTGDKYPGTVQIVRCRLNRVNTGNRPCLTEGKKKTLWFFHIFYLW